MGRVLHLVRVALCLMFACASATAQEYNDGSIKTNRNTTGTLTGLNDHPDLFDGPPVIPDPVPKYRENAPVNPALGQAPVTADSARVNPNPDTGSFFSSIFSDDTPKGPRSGLGLVDR